jgi:hypothetical protein
MVPDRLVGNHRNVNVNVPPSFNFLARHLWIISFEWFRMDNAKKKKSILKPVTVTDRINDGLQTTCFCIAVLFDLASDEISSFIAVFYIGRVSHILETWVWCLRNRLKEIEYGDLLTLLNFSFKKIYSVPKLASWYGLTIICIVLIFCFLVRLGTLKLIKQFQPTDSNSTYE